MKNNEWFSFAEASRLAKKSRAWLSLVRKIHPEYFENVEIKKIGRSLVISQEGLDTVLKQIKKVGDRLRILPLKAVYKTKKHLCFYPTHHYIKIAIN